jgi:hypothetical protein
MTLGRFTTITLGRMLPAQTMPISAHFSSEHLAADEAPFLLLPECTLPTHLSMLDVQAGLQCSLSIRSLRLDGSKHEAQALVEIPIQAELPIPASSASHSANTLEEEMKWG